MKVRIVSDGTPQGTTIVDAITGKRIENVTKVAWVCDAKHGTRVLLQFTNIEVDVTGETDA